MDAIWLAAPPGMSWIGSDVKFGIAAVLAVADFVAVTVLLLTVSAIFVVRRVLGGWVRHVATSG